MIAVKLKIQMSKFRDQCSKLIFRQRLNVKVVKRALDNDVRPQSFTKSLSNGLVSSSMTVGYPQGWIVAKLYGAGHHLKAAL